MKKKQSAAPCEPTKELSTHPRYKQMNGFAMRYFHITDMIDAPFISMDLFRFMLGDKIGSGAYRDVFEFNILKNAVIKCSVGEDVKANLMEWNVWNAAKGTKLEKWLAPCIDISPAGHFLIQERCRPILDSDRIPKNIPRLLTDIKKSNFGFIEDRFVCHDYQFISNALDLAFNTSMKPLEFL